MAQWWRCCCDGICSNDVWMTLEFIGGLCPDFCRNGAVNCVDFFGIATQYILQHKVTGLSFNSVPFSGAQLKIPLIGESMGRCVYFITITPGGTYNVNKYVDSTCDRPPPSCDGIATPDVIPISSIDIGINRDSITGNLIEAQVNFHGTGIYSGFTYALFSHTAPGWSPGSGGYPLLVGSPVGLVNQLTCAAGAVATGGSMSVQRI